jgi:hypothetical protein
MKFLKFGIFFLINLIFIKNQDNSTHSQDHNQHNEHNQHSENYDRNQHNEPSELITSQFSLDWETKMVGYEPDYVYMIPVFYKRREVFLEQIDNLYTTIKGAFLLDESSKDTIDFSIISPTGEKIIETVSNHYIFEFFTKEAGTYQIVFDNRYSNSELKITFTMNTGKNPILKKEDLSVVEQKVGSLVDFMKQYKTNFKMRSNVHTERYRSKIIC